jgi:hypothetical protein
VNLDDRKRSATERGSAGTPLREQRRLAAMRACSHFNVATRGYRSSPLQTPIRDQTTPPRILFPESSLVIGTAVEYRIATLAGRNAGLTLSLPKARLRALQRRPPD